MRRSRKSLGFLAALEMVGVLTLAACSKSDQTAPAEPRVSDLPAPQGNHPVAPQSAPDTSSRSGGY